MEQIFVPILVSDSEAEVVLLSLIKPANSERKVIFCFIFPGVNIKRSCSNCSQYAISAKPILGGEGRPCFGVSHKVYILGSGRSW